jgi:polysaccharide export outer membrane protein
MRLEETNSLCGLLLSLALVGCAVELHLDEPFELPEPLPAVRQQLIAVGDVISAEFSRRHLPVNEYRLSIADRVEINLSQQPDKTRTVTVASDGTIQYYQIGSVLAAGLTLAELREKLEELLRDHFTLPKVTLFLLQGDTLAGQFIEMLLTHPSGATREVKVDPQGMISLPGVGPIQLQGVTLQQASERIHARLQESFPSLQVVLSSLHQARYHFSVLGEVNIPGRYPLPGSLSLVEALAMAQGETEYGDMEQVVLIRRYPEEIRARAYDVENAFLHGYALEQIQLEAGDTVLVLRTGVGRSNEAIDQFIRKNIPIPFSIGYRFD